MPEITKRAAFYARRCGPQTFHIEVDGAIVNIMVGLETRNGRQVTRVDIIPDDERRGGDSDGRVWKDLGDGRVVRLHENEHDLPADPDGI